MNKKLVPILLVILAVSNPKIGSSFALSVPKPSVPEFTLKFADNSYSIPPDIRVNPYTGKNMTFQESFFYQNRSIELTINNQPFTPYIDDNGHSISLFYNISEKGHFVQSWDEYPNWANAYFEASNSGYTVLDFGLEGDNASIWSDARLWLPYAESGQVDFRVQAFIGYLETIQDNSSQVSWRPTYQQFYSGETSDWSITQTVTIPEISSVSPNISPTFEFPTLEILPLLLSILSLLLSILSVVVILRRRRIESEKKYVRED